MEKTKDLIDVQELKSNILAGSFGKNPHPVYAVYDDLMDEFIIKLLKPDTLVTACFVSDTFALLAEVKTKEVVGYQLGNFTEEYLDEFPALSKNWDWAKDKFSHYQELSYRPDNKGDGSDRKLLGFQPEVLDETLVPA